MPKLATFLLSVERRTLQRSTVTSKAFISLIGLVVNYNKPYLRSESKRVFIYGPNNVKRIPQHLTKKDGNPPTTVGLLLVVYLFVRLHQMN
jgi:hypothetical protein